jgi:integrase
VSELSNNQEKRDTPKFARVATCLYRKGAVIYARVPVSGKLAWKSTETNDLPKALKWLTKWKHEEWALNTGIELPGVVLHRQRTVVRELVDRYTAAGFPTRKMQSKSPATIRNEEFFLNPIRAYFGDKVASAVTHADCDKYRDWRLSGGYVSTFKVRGGHPRTMKTKGGNRSVDLELTVLSNVFNFAVRRNELKSNPFAGRGRYSVASDVRHCREVAPTPEGLKKIEDWMRNGNENAVADLVCFLAYSGLRIGEALPLTWGAVNWDERIIHVKREKRGVNPWVVITPTLETLLRQMKASATGELLFPSPFDPNKRRDASAVRHRITAACKKLNIGHVTPHGLRSYFVTSARQSGLTDAEIAALIGDKTGPAIIAHTYGDVRPNHLIAQAQRILFTVSNSQ